jgi:hypothetical protein
MIKSFARRLSTVLAATAVLGGLGLGLAGTASAGVPASATAPPLSNTLCSHALDSEATCTIPRVDGNSSVVGLSWFSHLGGGRVGAELVRLDVVSPKRMVTTYFDGSSGSAVAQRTFALGTDQQGRSSWIEELPRTQEVNVGGPVAPPAPGRAPHPSVAPTLERIFDSNQANVQLWDGRILGGVF